MRRVNPVTEYRDVDRLVAVLASRHLRYALLYRLGCGSGLRVSDLLSLRCDENLASILGGQTDLVMQKTKQAIRLHIDEQLQHDIIKYARTLRKGEYLFWSRPNRKDRSLTRQHVHRVLKASGASIGLSHIGCHTTRRTYAVGLYRATNDLLAVQQALGHKYLSSTLCYLLDADRHIIV